MRRTLTITSMIGLVVSLLLFGVSYLRVQFLYKDLQINLLMPGTCFVIWGGELHTSRDTTGWRKSQYNDANVWSSRHTTILIMRQWIWHFPMWLPISQWYGSRDGTNYVTVLLWIPTTFFAAIVGYRSLPVFRRRKRRKLGLCINCGYNLDGLTENRCPECATEFHKVG